MNKDFQINREYYFLIQIFNNIIIIIIAFIIYYYINGKKKKNKKRKIQYHIKNINLYIIFKINNIYTVNNLIILCVLLFINF